MNKYAFYNLRSEGKLIFNYSQSDLKYLFICFLILLIPLEILTMIFFKLSALNDITIIEDNLKFILQIILGLIITFGITLTLTNPDAYDDSSLVKDFITPKIVYMLKKQYYSNYSEEDYFPSYQKVSSFKYLIYLYMYIPKKIVIFLLCLLILIIITGVYIMISPQIDINFINL